MVDQVILRKSIKFTPQIIVIGALIGIANYAMGHDSNLMRIVFIHILTSIFIGWPLIVLVFIYPNLKEKYQNTKLSIGTYLFIAFVIGLIGTELELLVRQTAFGNGQYIPFSGKGIYLFNGIIAALLANVFRTSSYLLQNSSFIPETSLPLENDILNIPIKKGKSTMLLPIDDAVLIEAFDKYTYVYNHQGDKLLCDYGISFLEEKLPSKFVRVHRKYIANQSKIKSIELYDKSRYTISFISPQVPKIKNGATYLPIIKSLIKL